MKFPGIMPIILAGGLGRRLSPVVADRPKPLAPVSGRPFVSYLLERIAAAGFRETVLATGHLGELFPEIMGSAFGALKLTYSQETSPLGTGGGVRQAMALPCATAYRWFLVLNGDSLVDMVLAEFLDWAQRAVPVEAAKLVLVRVEWAARYGTVECDGHCVRAFREKEAESGPAWINAGVYLLSREHLEKWPVGRNFSLERDCLPQLAEAGQLYGWSVAAPFIDIGLPETYRQAAAFLRGR